LICGYKLIATAKCVGKLEEINTGKQKALPKQQESQESFGRTLVLDLFGMQFPHLGFVVEEVEIVVLMLFEFLLVREVDDHLPLRSVGRYLSLVQMDLS
jgi:hypothetical protein